MGKPRPLPPADVDISSNDEVDDDEDDAVEVVKSVSKENAKRPTRKFKNDTKNQDDKSKLSNGAGDMMDLKRILIAPKQIGATGWKDFVMIPLVHPRTKVEAMFLVDLSVSTSTNKNSNTEGIVFELLTMKNQQDLTSWFVGESVVSDGNIYALTLVDPLFLFLPAIAKCSKARPLFDHLEDVFPSNVAQVFSKRVSSEQVENIAIKKVAGDITAFQYSEERVLEWLAAKVQIVTDILKFKKIRSSEVSVSLNYCKSDNDPGSDQDYKRYACDIVSEYIDDSLKNKVLEKLGLPTEPLRSKRKNSDVDNEVSKKFKTSSDGDGIPVAPTEDYGSSNVIKPSPKTQATVKQKRLQEAAKGTHSLFKFFAPKTK